MVPKTQGQPNAGPPQDLLTETLPARLRGLRAAKGVSQFAAAEGAHVSLTFYHRLERGRENPSVRSLQQIASFFGVQPSDLIR